MYNSNFVYITPEPAQKDPCKQEEYEKNWSNLAESRFYVSQRDHYENATLPKHFHSWAALCLAVNIRQVL